MKTESHSIHDVLSKNSTSFFIPPFQRAYAWGKSEIERYFQDISQLIDSELSSTKDKQEHFFGTLVLKKETGSLSNTEIIVDGQQRLTTTLLFLIALRDSEEDLNNKNFITDTYLLNNSSGYQDKIKLKQVTKDWDSYRALVSEENNVPGLITSAYEQLKRLISAHKQGNQSVTFLHYILAIQRVNVAVIILDERPFKGEDPQIIFETLNSLGKPLSLSDLIRNFVLLKYESNSQSKIYDNVWYPKIESVLGEYTSAFFRDYLQFKGNTTLKGISDNNTKELYHVFKEYVSKSFTDNDEFIKDVTKYVEPYKWIVNELYEDEVSTVTNNNLKIKELIRNIFHDIQAEAFKPFVLGLLQLNQDNTNDYHIPDDKLISILSHIRTYVIRRRMLKLTQGENKYFTTCCGKIYKLALGEISIIDILTGSFYKLRMPNDAEIKNTLESLNFYEEMKKYSKFILGKIEENSTKVSVDFRNSKITIEHVMPQTLDESWKKDLGTNYSELHDKYLHNIGNLILTEFNSEIGNKPFKFKCAKIINSSLSYRLSVIDKEKWNEESILEHQEKMINGFLQTFSLPEEIRFVSNYNANPIEDVFLSPLSNDAQETAEGNKPLELIINNTIYKSKSWQEVFIQFIKYIHNSKDYDFGIIMDNQAQLFGRTKTILRWGKVKENKDNFISTQYKLFDGRTPDSSFDVDSLDDSDILIHVNITASTCIGRIAAVIDKFNMPDEFVKIRLK